MVTGPPLGTRLVGRIPVRNLWLLMLYASELTRFRDKFNALVDDDCDELPNLVAGLLWMPLNAGSGGISHAVIVIARWF
jgi:hypothetical protein